jgi:hypothetical protein
VLESATDNTITTKKDYLDFPITLDLDDKFIYKVDGNVAAKTDKTLLKVYINQVNPTTGANEALPDHVKITPVYDTRQIKLEDPG